MDWDKAFREASSHTWPPHHPAGLAVSNVKPPGGRNLFKEDNQQIMEAARRHGFEILGPPTARVVSFIKRG